MKVVITGVGVITSLGCTVDDLWLALLSGRTATREWPDLAAEGFLVTSACRIPEFDHGNRPRGRAMAIAAARQAVKDSALSAKDQVGVFVGTTMGESAAFERAAEGEPLDLETATGDAYALAIRDTLGLNGPTFAFGTACAAGNYAIGAATDAIRSGSIRFAVAGGIDAFSRIAMVGFSRSRAMAPDLCRPFDASRQGMQLGEGAAFMILENEEDARRRGACTLASVRTLGLSCDAYRLVPPRPDGSGMAESMRRAIKQGGIEPRDIGFICAHGSGTKVSDRAEAQAINTIFEHRPAVSGFKGAVGHTLGATTAIEAVLTAFVLRNQLAPPTTNLLNVDASLNLNLISREPQRIEGLKWALNCGYAFGGLNSALLMGVA